MVKFKQEENKHERLKYSVLHFKNIIAREHGRSYLTDHTRDS